MNLKPTTPTTKAHAAVIAGHLIDRLLFSVRATEAAMIEGGSGEPMPADHVWPECCTRSVCGDYVIRVAIAELERLKASSQKPDDLAYGLLHVAELLRATRYAAPQEAKYIRRRLKSDIHAAEEASSLINDLPHIEAKKPKHDA
ncbi:hypothetical protein AAV94_12725 [Lampropedia cohaerens]|uniref:Uncharacterized protein n=2 Tax=Lampropedia cohaerens TaxID=1610491 RepID=A0A0U1PX71_9BURK|nr:hypothetical protein AAV94_12725 [Lampropedia cohaerens]